MLRRKTELLKSVKANIYQFLKKIESDKPTGNRFIMTLIGGLFLLNYLAFCYHTDKNPFYIFPSLPLLDERNPINVYLPDIDGETILKEERVISRLDDNKGFIRLLFNIVIKGSYYENTSPAIPIDTYIRKIWIRDEICIIDLGLSIINYNLKIIKGSETIFKISLEKTISENIPTIKKVILLEQGIPEKPLWEIQNTD